MKSPALLYITGLLLVLTAGLSCMTEPAPIAQGPDALHSPQPDTTGGRPAAWAAPLVLPGVGNFHKISDTLFRGEQPTVEGFRELKKYGIKTIVNLRGFHSDRDEVEEAGLKADLKLEHIYFNTWHPELEDIEKFLTIITDPANQPVFFHCAHGSDRTGTMCAIYRITVCDWTREQAIDEMVHGNYGFHGVWQNLIDYLQGLRTETITRLQTLARKNRH